jgi:hypothetical protein
MKSVPFDFEIVKSLTNYFDLTPLEKLETFKTRCYVDEDLLTEISEFKTKLILYMADLKFLETDISPTNDGGTSITIFKKDTDWFLDIYVNGDGTMDYHHEKGIGWKYTLFGGYDNITFETIIYLMNRLNN